MASEPISIGEYETVELTRGEFNLEAAQVLRQGRYQQMVAVDAPSVFNDMWRLSAQGWIGYIPLLEDVSIRLEPKTPILNLFGMFEYAYRLKSFEFGKGLVNTKSLQDVYEQLASVLAKRVLDRSRKGLYRTYLADENRLTYIRGRFDVWRNLRRPWDTGLYCHYHEHTADVVDNQLLAWTLWRIVRSGFCSNRTLPLVRKAYRAVQGFVSLRPFSSDDCDGRLYHRLNQDYHPLHALSRFFLSQSGPSHLIGNREMVPFAVNMARLFELFVAEWLKLKTPDDWVIKSQVSLPFGSQNQMSFLPDIVVEDANTGRTLAVLDTKYKVTDTPAYSDITQMTTYAYMLGCEDAVLIYPVMPPKAETYNIGGIRIHNIAFGIHGSVEEDGQKFLNSLSTVVEDIRLRNQLLEY